MAVSPVYTERDVISHPTNTPAGATTVDHTHCTTCYRTTCNHSNTNAAQNGDSCPLIRCPRHCWGGTVSFHACKLDDHLTLCPAECVPCVNRHNGCPRSMPRHRLANHIRRCPASVVQCNTYWCYPPSDTPPAVDSDDDCRGVQTSYPFGDYRTNVCAVMSSSPAVNCADSGTVYSDCRWPGCGAYFGRRRGSSGRRFDVHFCARLLRREEIAAHWRHHSDVRCQMDGWIVLKCPLAYRGCAFSLRRFRQGNTTHTSSVPPVLHTSDDQPIESSDTDDATGNLLLLMPFEILFQIAGLLDSASLGAFMFVSKTTLLISKVMLIAKGCVVLPWYKNETGKWLQAEEKWFYSGAGDSENSWAWITNYEAELSQHFKVCEFYERSKHVGKRLVLPLALDASNWTIEEDECDEPQIDSVDSEDIL